MSEILKIECPKCGKKFDAGSAFNAHIASTKKQQEEIIKKESEKKFKSQLESKDKEIDKTRKEAEKRIKNSVSTEFENKIQVKWKIEGRKLYFQKVPKNTRYIPKNSMK